MLFSSMSGAACCCCAVAIHVVPAPDGGSRSAGGVEDGENGVQAAIREIREETGLSIPSSRLRPVVWTRQTLFSVDGRHFDQYEEYGLGRITATEVVQMQIDNVEALRTPLVDGGRVGRH